MTEIFGTLGPSCKDQETLEKMLLAGMSGVRLNLSHSSLPESRDMIDNLHKACAKTGLPCDLLIDLQGPEVRLNRLKEPIELRKDEIRAFSDLAFPEILENWVESNDTILIDDGMIELRAIDPDFGIVIRGGTVESKKSVKIVNKDIDGPLLTEQDWENLRIAKQYGVTAVMQPFVKSGAQLRELKQNLRHTKNEDIRIFAKIENRNGVENIANIIPEADMIVIARGDLGNDMPLWHLPAVQKDIEAACRKAGKKFLVVTQMLTTMIKSMTPTRAEVSDIFNAVTDGASAVMVTNETATGLYPVEVIRYLTNTCREAEEWMKKN